MRLELNQNQKDKIIAHLKGELLKTNKELEKVQGCSPLQDGWQTSKFAKKSRKWDELAKKKMAIIEVLYNDWGIEI